MDAAAIDQLVEAILRDATLAEKVGMMSGKGFFAAYREDKGRWGARPYRAGGGIERLNVPALWFTDGPRGVARGESTCFPCSMARGASFDAGLERRIGEAMGMEIRAQGCNFSGAVCMNLLRHPAWGRAQETYGEDTHHLGVMGSALGLGIQAHNVIATVKHFALNSMENARFFVDVEVDERTLHEIYLPHFKAALDAGVASVMSAYNKMNGEYCGQNGHLLTDILRGEWGFDGFVHSDWVKGVYAPYGASAGLDIENPEPLVWGEKLLAAVEAGHVEPQVIDTACRRILTTLYRFASAEDPLPDYPASLVACEAHRALALEAAEKSAVLLRNTGVLPFDRSRVTRVAVLGRMAGLAITGDNGSSRVRPPYVVTPVDGLRRYLGDDAVIAVALDDPDAVRDAASSADAIIVVVGTTAEDEGEYIPGDMNLGQGGGSAQGRDAIGGDRTDLCLRSEQVALIHAAAATGKPVAVVIVSGSAIMVEGWHTSVGAILQTFYAGMEGGTALARLLFGDVSPSGKLPFTLARDVRDYPPFDRDAKRIQYGYWHGYQWFDHDGLEPRYPFGHGLSYVRFAYCALKARVSDNAVHVSIAVRNDGVVAADEVVQIYVGCPGAVAVRPHKSLRAFRRVTLNPGEARIVDLTVNRADLAWRDPETHRWKEEKGHYRLYAGGSSVHSLECEFIL